MGPATHLLQSTTQSHTLMKAELQCQVCGEWFETSFLDFNDRAHFDRVAKERTLTKAHGKNDQCTFCGMTTAVASEYMRWPGS